MQIISFVLLIQEVQVDFARAHDDHILQCTCDILHVDPVQARSVKGCPITPLCAGRFGAQERGAGARVRVLGELGRLHPRTSSLRGLLSGTEPDLRQDSLRSTSQGAASRVDQRFRNEDLFARVDGLRSKLLCRSQGGPVCAGLDAVYLSHVSHHEDRPSALQGHPVAPPPSPSSLDRAFPAGVAFHSTLVATTVQLALGLGSWGRRGYDLETVTARICREAGGRVTTNVMVRDLDVAEPNAADTRRLEALLTVAALRGSPARHRHNHREHTPRERRSTEIP